MTDRDKLHEVSAALGSLKADVDAYLTTDPPDPPLDPVDEVGEFVLLPENIGPLSSCQPNGFKHQSELWTWQTLVPASNGGKVYDGPREQPRINDQAEACVYVPPVGRVIFYRIEIFDPSHQHSFTDVAEMKKWVPAYRPRIPEPVPCQIEWTGYDGTFHKHEFPTFAEFVAFIAAFVPEPPPPVENPDPDVLPFTGQRRWREIWPTWTPENSLSFAPAGWLTGEGFKEPRAFVEANWWDTGHQAGKEHEGDLDHARHLHIGAAVPRVVSGIFDIFARIRTFHWNEAKLAGITGMSFEMPGSRQMMPCPISQTNDDPVCIIRLPLTEHIHDICVPIRIDTTNCLTDGWCLFVVGVDIQRNDGVHHLVNFKVPVYVQNGNPRKDSGGTGFVQSTGWMTEYVTDPVTGAEKELNTFGYLSTNCLTSEVNGIKGPKRFLPDPHTEYVFRCSTGTGRFPLDMLVTKNPNFHLHPVAPREDPNYMGQVLVDELSVIGSKVNVRVPNPELAVGDRIVCRVSDRKPVGYHFVTLADGTRRVMSAQSVLPDGAVIDTDNPIVLKDPNGAVATVLAITMGA